MKPPTQPQAPTAASVLTLLAGIESHGPNAPATIAFRAALARKGREAAEVEGARGLDRLLHEITAADPSRADARIAVVRAAWSERLPARGERPAHDV